MSSLILEYAEFTPIWGSHYMQPFLWLLILGLLFAACVGFSMGANDVANSFGTSVAARVVSIPQAIILAGFFTYIGAQFLGGAVTDTIRKGIVSLSVFVDSPHIYMASMTGAYIGTFALVMGSTILKMPVSTTHAVVGGVLGTALAAFGSSAVNWFEAGLVVIAWFASPVFAGIFTAGFYLMQQRLVLREKNIEKAKWKQIWFGSVQVGLIAWILTFFLLTNSVVHVPDWLKIAKIDKGAPTWPGSLLLPLICFLVMFVVIIGSRYLLIPALYNALEKDGRSKGAVQEEVNSEIQDLQHVEKTDGYAADIAGIKSTKRNWRNSLFSLNHEGSPYALQKHVISKADTLHKAADEYPPEIENRFRGIQIITACYMALSHGANDIANVIGPLAGILEAFNLATLDKKSSTDPGTLAYGAIFIILGLATYGTRVMATVAHNTTKITPSRGVNVELGAGFALTIASYLGIPTSSTQCIVGSIIAVGLCNKERFKTVNGSLLGLIFTTWLATPIVSGLIAAAFFTLFNEVAVNQVPDDFFPISNVSTAYGVHYSFGKPN